MLNFYYKRWLTGTDDAYGLSICEIQYVQWCWTPVFHFISISLYWSGHTREIKINTHTHAQFEKWLWCWRWLWVKERQRKQQKKKKPMAYLIRTASRIEKVNGIEKAGVYQYFFKMNFVGYSVDVWSSISHFNFLFLSLSFHPLHKMKKIKKMKLNFTIDFQKHTDGTSPSLSNTASRSRKKTHFKINVKSTQHSMYCSRAFSLTPW